MMVIGASLAQSHLLYLKCKDLSHPSLIIDGDDVREFEVAKAIRGEAMHLVEKRCENSFTSLIMCQKFIDDPVELDSYQETDFELFIQRVSINPKPDVKIPEIVTISNSTYEFFKHKRYKGVIDSLQSVGTVEGPIQSFFDSVRVISRNETNIKLNPEVNGIQRFEIDNKVRFLVINCTWTLVDQYGDTLASATLSGCSLPTKQSPDFNAEFSQAFKSSLTKFYNLDGIQEALYTYTDYWTSPSGWKEIKLVHHSDSVHGSLEQAINSTVTIKCVDGHGSGIVISRDGLILTNYHVIEEDTTGIYRVDEKGDKTSCKLIRYNPGLDLAIIKCQDEFVEYFDVVDVDPERGETVYTIGTPIDLLLFQTVSKGILSAFRNRGGIVFLQTDARVSPGNSGGPLVLSDGRLIGIISQKMVGLAVEGIAFAIPIELAMQKLKLVY